MASSHKEFTSRLEKLVCQIPPLMAAASPSMANFEAKGDIKNKLQTRCPFLEESLVRLEKNRRDVEIEDAVFQVSMVAKAYPVTTKATQSITAAVCVVSLGSTSLVYLAWTRSQHNPSTTQDADFWTLLQSSIMQLLSPFTMIYPVWRRSWMSWGAWTWTWLFVTVSLLCTVAAPLLYIVVPIQWSLVLSFGGNVAQALVVLQLMQVIEEDRGVSTRPRKPLVKQL